MNPTPHSSRAGRRPALWAPPATLLLLLASLSASNLACSAETGEPQAPDGPGALRVVDAAGLRSALEEGDAEGTLVNFWATWCVPCVAEMPELAEVAREYADRGLRVVAVSTDYVVPGEAPSPVQIATFADERGWGLELLYFRDPVFESLDEAFDLPGPIPVTLALDAQGSEVDRVEGPAELARFEALARAALGG